jgi:hypothetical protein
MDSYMPDITVYEVYMSAYDVTAWRDGAVYRTAFRETSWFPQSQVNANRPRVTGIIYVAAADEFACANMTIRIRKERQ